MSKYLILLFTFLVSSFAHSVPLLWSRCYGGSDSEGLSKIFEVPNGYIFLGNSFSSDGDLSFNYGQNDITLFKIDSAGDVLWQKSYGGSAGDFGSDLVICDDGGFIIAGYSYSNDIDIHANHGLLDILLMRLDSSGNLMWSRNYGGTQDDAAFKIIKKSNNKYIIGGLTNSTDGDFLGNQTTGSIILMTDSSGNLISQNDYGPNSAGIYDMVLNNRGNIVFTGPGSFDLWLCEIDSANNVLWQKSYGGSQSEVGYALKQIEDGYIVCGSAESSDGDLLWNYGVNGSTDGWVIRVDSTGNLIWQKSFGGSQSERLFTIEQLPDSTFMIGGHTLSGNYDAMGCNFSAGFLVNLDFSGNLLWKRCYGGSADDAFSSILSLNDGNVLIGGYTGSNDGDVSGNHGNIDQWILKLEATTLRIEMVETPSIKLSPNPTTGGIRIQSDYKFSSIEVFDLYFNRLIGFDFESTTDYNIDLESIPKGVYIINITGDTTLKRLFIKQ